ncbi:MAG: hypothetical protein JWQ72_2224 [Polaromonas sp.]|nr:hypothetical protein [Polaromonas sp.]
MPLRRAAARLEDALRRTPFWSEVLSGAAIFGFAAWSVIGPGDLTDRPGYRQFGSIPGAMAVELIGMTLGAVQFYVALRWNHDTRWWMAAFAAAWWINVSLSIYRWDAHAPAIPVFLIYGLGNLISMVRLGGGIPASWRRPT